MSRSVVSKDGTFAYVPGAILKLNLPISATSGSTPSQSADAAAVAPTTPVIKDQKGELAKWGEDNLFPQNVMKDVERNTVLATSLLWKAKAWYGSGVVYGTVEGYDDNGNEHFIRKAIPDVDLFLKNSNIRRYAFEALTDISFFVNAFPELIVSKNRKKIALIAANDAAFCRFAKPSNNGVIDYAYVNANWDNGATIDDPLTTKVRVLDPYFNAVESVRSGKDFKYIYPINVPSPGKAEYQLASWNTVRQSGWLKVAKAIPEFKEKLFQNQMAVKYLIEIHHGYWEWKFGEWEKKTPSEKAKIIQDELDSFNAVMTGTEGAGKSILATTVRNKKTGEDIAAFKVTAIDDKIKDGIYIEDSQEAASHIYTAVGVAPTLMGISPGKGMGAGSGSDARVAFNNFISTSRYEQDIVLEPLELVRDYNGWDPNLKFRFQNPLIMTLDKGKQVQQETS